MRDCGCHVTEGKPRYFPLGEGVERCSTDVHTVPCGILEDSGGYPVIIRHNYGQVFIRERNRQKDEACGPMVFSDLYARFFFIKAVQITWKFLPQDTPQVPDSKKKK